MMSSSLRFAIDTGGTFTDIVVLDEETGRFWIEKALTTPGDVLEGMLAAIARAKIDLADVGRFFVYGSTTALNALLERKGVKTAYLTTRGFRDVPQIGRVNRPELYNPKYKKPAQIVPRHLRFEVTERIGADGAIVTPLDEANLREVARDIARHDVQAVAVCFLHAYRNPAHEARAGTLLRQLLPGVSITLSSIVAPEQREFERATTTILNGYLSPVVERVLADIEDVFKSKGFGGTIILTKSDGGGMSARVAKERAINTLLSGPAGGVIGAQYIAQVTGYKNLITADVGGTSFDVGVIKNGAAAVNQELDARGFPVLMPNLGIRTIGAGGGSIARLDRIGALHVGPESAGAKPGPVCYGRGGAAPTVTDAALVSGYIDPAYFLGGDMALDAAGAKAAIMEHVAGPAGLSLNAATCGILQIALSHMAGAIRDVLSESGDDPRDFRVLCYGGGGPLFAAALAHELALPAAIVPVAPGNFSAWGMLMIDVRNDGVRAFHQPLAGADIDGIGRAFDALIAEGRRVLAQENVPEDRSQYHLSLDMRYIGQGHTVSTPFNPGDSKAAVLERFHAVYADAYGYVLELPIEIVNLRVKAIGSIPKPKLSKLAKGGDASRAAKGSRAVVDMIDGQERVCTVYDRALLRSGDIIAGPALIEEATSITPIRHDQICTADDLGNLLISPAASVELSR